MMNIYDVKNVNLENNMMVLKVQPSKASSCHSLGLIDEVI